MNKVTSLYIQVYESLRARIYSADFAYGSKLPSIASLANEYGVSIITIRKALNTLCDNGLIEIQQGKEALVTFNNLYSPHREKYLIWLIEHSTSILDIYWMHQLIVPQIMVLGAMNTGENSLKKIKFLLSDIRTEKENLHKLLDKLQSFMTEIISNTHNEIFVALFTKAHTFIQIPLLLASDSKEMHTIFYDKTIKCMKTLLNLIENNDYSGLYNYVIKSYKFVTELFKEYLNDITVEDYQYNDIPFVLSFNIQGSFRYSKIANDILLSIACAEYYPGAYLPSESDICKIYDASPATVRRALKLLNEYKVIKTINGKGSLIIYNFEDDENILEEPYHSEIEVKTNLQCLQLLALVTPVWIKISFENISDNDISAFESKFLAEVNERGIGQICSIAVLINFIYSFSPCIAIREIYPRLLFNMCLNSRHRSYYINIYPELYDLMDAQTQEAIKLLKTKDYFGVAKLILDQINTHQKLVKQIYKNHGYNFNLPLIESDILLNFISK